MKLKSKQILKIVPGFTTLTQKAPIFLCGIMVAVLMAACGDATVSTGSAATAGAVITTTGTTSAATAVTAANTSPAQSGSSTQAGVKGKVIVGSKAFTENTILAEIYSQALENAGLSVERKYNLGTVDIAQAVLLKGEISLYPEYTSTALLAVLKEEKTTNEPKAIYDQVVKGYTKFNLTVLDAAPLNNTFSIAVTKAAADKYNLKTLSDLATKADQLRLAAYPDWLGNRSEIDGLKSLQKTYGGFIFKDVKSFDVTLRYSAITSGNADAVVAFTTDGDIKGNNLVLLEDDKLNFPPYQGIPIVRNDVLAANPNIKTVLNQVSAKLTNNKVSAMNWKVDGPEKQEPVDVARDFLKTEGIIIAK